MINLLSGIADGYIKGLNSNLEEQQKSDLRKLQIKQFQRQLDAQDQIEQAKQGLLAYLTKATAPTPAVQGNQDYNSLGADENTGFDVQSRPAMPGMSFKQAMNTPEALRLAIGAGHNFNDIKQFQQPSLVDLMAEYQKNAAIGGRPAGTGNVNPVVRMNADGTGYLELDPNKSAEVLTHQQRLELEKRKTDFEIGGGGAGFSGSAGMTPKAKAELEAKRTEEKPQVLAAIRNTNANFDRLAAAAKALKDNPDLKYATGSMSMLGMIPGTDAKGVQADIEALKSQIGFNVMQALRDAGKTGSSGLGALNETELKNLQNNLASLDTQQKPEKVRKSLQAIIDYVEEAKARQLQHYKDAYGESPNSVKKPSLDSFSGNKSDPLGLR